MTLFGFGCHWRRTRHLQPTTLRIAQNPFRCSFKVLFIVSVKLKECQVVYLTPGLKHVHFLSFHLWPHRDRSKYIARYNIAAISRLNRNVWQRETMAEGYKDFIAGTIGGFSGKLLDYPFDTVKVLLQTQNSLAHVETAAATAGGTAAATAPQTGSAPVYRGAFHCLQHTIETRGFLSLYQGLASPLLGSMAENAVLFLSYGEVKRMLGEKPGQELSLLQLATAGGVAGAIVSFVLNPFEVIKGE